MIKEIEWVDKWGCKCSLTVEQATRILKEYYDAWPGGLDEITSAVESLQDTVVELQTEISTLNKHN